MNWLLPLAITAQLADTSTTVVGLHRGCEERMYPLKNPVGIVSVKSGSLGIFLILYPRIKKEHPQLMETILAGLLASGVIVTAINLHTLPHCRP